MGEILHRTNITQVLAGEIHQKLSGVVIQLPPWANRPVFELLIFQASIVLWSQEVNHLVFPGSGK